MSLSQIRLPQEGGMVTIIQARAENHEARSGNRDDGPSASIGPRRLLQLEDIGAAHPRRRGSRSRALPINPADPRNSPMPRSLVAFALVSALVAPAAGRAQSTQAKPAD